MSGESVGTDPFSKPLHELRARLLTQVRSASLQHHPFPFLFGALGRGDFESAYPELRRMFPIKTRSPELARDPEDYRDIVRPQELEGAGREFWNAALPEDFNDDLARALTQKFLPFIPRFRRRDPLAKLRSFLRGDRSKFAPLTEAERRRLLSTPPEKEWMFTADSDGYGLDPHTDHPRKMITFLLYLSEPGGAPLPGTSVYAPLRPLAAWDSYRVPRTEFSEAFRADHAEGIFLAFVKSDLSWHGVEPCSGPKRRYTLNMTVRRPDFLGG